MRSAKVADPLKLYEDLPPMTQLGAGALPQEDAQVYVTASQMATGTRPRRFDNDPHALAAPSQATTGHG